MCCIVLQCVAAATGPFLTPPLVTGTNSPTNFTARVALCYTAHALICTHALAHTRSYTFACSHSLAGTRLHAFARRHSLAHPCMLTHPCMLHVDTFSNTRVVLRMDTHTHTHTRTHMYTHIRTHTHAHTLARTRTRSHARTHAPFPPGGGGGGGGPPVEACCVRLLLLHYCHFGHLLPLYPHFWRHQPSTLVDNTRNP